MSVKHGRLLLRKIILIGSFACGRPTSESDVDLLVIMPFKGRDTKQVVKICSRVRPSFPMDMLVLRPEEVAKRLSLEDSFIKEVLTRGRVMYEAG